MIWKKYSLENEKVYRWQIGLLEFFVRKINKEWQVAHKKTEGVSNVIEIAKEVPDPVDVEWKSIIGDIQNTLLILPALPDRSVVVKPDSTFRLLPEKVTQLYIHMPVWIQLYSGPAQRENLICEIPSFELSSTWFGDPESGVLSYSLPKGCIKNFVDININNHEIICSLRITNDSSSQLDFQRICLHVESLNIYSAGKTLLANETKVRFKGENSISDIKYVAQAPSFVEKAEHTAAPRHPGKSGVLKKSFHFFKSLTEY